MRTEQIFALVAGVVCLGFAFGAARWAAARFATPVEPLGLFALGWGVELLLFAIPWVEFSPTGIATWLGVYASIMAFIVAALFAYRRWPATRPFAPVQRLDHGRLRIAWLGCLGIGLIGFAGFVHAVDVVLGARALIDQPALVRDIQSTSTVFQDTYGPFKLLFYFNQISFLLWTIALRDRAHRGGWKWIAPLGLLTIAPFLVTGERTLLGTALIWAVLFHLIWRPVARPRRVLAIAGLVVLILAGGFVALGARRDTTIDSQPEIASALTTRSLDVLALPYVYSTANIPTFEGLTQDPIRPTFYGQMTLLPLAKIAHRLHLAPSPPPEVGAFYPVPFESFNNFSWLGTFYLDFGWAGVVFGPALFGAAAAWAMSRAMRRRTLLWVWTASLLLYVVAFAPLLNKLSTTLTWQHLLLGLVIAPLISHPPPGRTDVARLLTETRASARRHRRALALIAVAAVAVLAGWSLLGTPGQRAEVVADRKGLASNFKGLDAQILETLNAGKAPEAGPLVSRLRVANPDLRLLPLTASEEVPRDGTIGLFSDGEEYWIRAESSPNRVIELHRMLGSDAQISAVPRAGAGRGSQRKR